MYVRLPNAYIAKESIMGTRHLIMVKVNNKVKLAQYGQWDGYLSGQGVEIAEFIHTYLYEYDGKSKLNEFKAKVQALQFVTSEESDAICDKTPDALFNMRHPAFSRDTSAKILPMIAHGFITKVYDSSAFLKDGLFCEYAYTLDLDKELLTIRTGKVDGGNKIAYKIAFSDCNRIHLNNLHKELQAKREAEYAAEQKALKVVKKRKKA